jgi:hypothetical protein
MGILDFLFGKIKTIDDRFFGKLLFIEYKDTTKNYFEGQKYFKPINQNISLIIDGDLSGPTEKQRQLFECIEDNYTQIVEKVIPLITDLFRNWKSEFIIKSFNNEFIPVHITIHRVIYGEVYWELSFETSHDLNHIFTVTFVNLEPTDILIDG